jgi:hypothetical protein
MDVKRRVVSSMPVSTGNRSMLDAPTKPMYRHTDLKCAGRSSGVAIGPPWQRVRISDLTLDGFIHHIADQIGLLQGLLMALTPRRRSIPRRSNRHAPAAVAFAAASAIRRALGAVESIRHRKRCSARAPSGFISASFTHSPCRLFRPSRGSFHRSGRRVDMCSTPAITQRLLLPSERPASHTRVGSVPFTGADDRHFI